MDFEALHEPYKGSESPSVAAQIAWLGRKGIPAEIIDKALLVVYDELSRGRVIEPQGEHSAGFMLDNYLLGTAQAMVTATVEAKHKELSEFLGGIRQKWEEDLVTLAKASGTSQELPAPALIEQPTSGKLAKVIRGAFWAAAAQGIAYEVYGLIRHFLG